MTDDIKIFSNPQFGEIRTLADEANEPLFCAADVCKVLGYTNPRKAVADHVSEDDVTKRDTIDNLGRTQSASFVNESGLYSLIFGSKLESAKAFKRWVTSEVLPAIRKTGGYLAAKDDDTPEMIMARAVIVAQATIEKQSKRLAEQSAMIERQDRAISRLQPKADFADAAFRAEGKVDIGQAAKILRLPFGRNTLFRKLKERGVFFANRNEPKQRYIDAGYFELSQLPPIKRDHHPVADCNEMHMHSERAGLHKHAVRGQPRRRQAFANTLTFFFTNQLKAIRL